jgi:3-oxoacyl-[acyl-carrier-protein] synthase II
MNMSSVPEVVVTGLGATTPLGGDVASTWASALAGQSGARTFDNDWAEKYGMPVNFAATIAVNPEEVLTRPETKRMDPSTQYAIIAAREAWKDAGAPEIDGTRLGTVVSSGIGGIWTTLDAWDTLREKGARRVLPMTVPMLMPNSPTGFVSLEFGAKAGAHALVSACASGAEAIGYGVEMIRSGRADVVIAGGTEATIHPMPISAFAASRTLSLRNDDPTGASRPYDINRDGFVIGEGSGIVLGDDADHVALSATKSMTGHLLGGAGALETIFTVLAVSERTAPPTINVSDPDPELTLDLVRDTPRALREGDIAAVNNSFGFGGHNVALVVQNA